jgi:hypothetical protein
MAKKRSKKMEVEVGSRNVFADLGFPDAAELDIKVRLAVEIIRLINTRRLSQVEAAAIRGPGRVPRDFFAEMRLAVHRADVGDRPPPRPKPLLTSAG